jgi:hypothetical protein
LLGAVATLGILVASAAPAGSATQTVVTIQFDDGNADAYGALAILPPTACTPRST